MCCNPRNILWVVGCRFKPGRQCSAGTWAKYLNVRAVAPKFFYALTPEEQWPKVFSTTSLWRSAHWDQDRRRGLWHSRRGGFPCGRRRKNHPPHLAGRSVQGRERVRERVPTDEHPPPPKHRPVSGCHLLSRLATARPCHGATAGESSWPAGSRYAAHCLAPSLLFHCSQVLRTAGRGARPCLPARAIAAHYPPRLVGQKHPPELRDGG